MNFKTEELPKVIENNSLVEITTNKVNYFTHGFFKYPCKFIPQIPRWAILKYTKKGDLVLDPFAGSGTTLVEAVLNGRKGLAVDFDKLSQLLCKSKTIILTKKQLNTIRELQPHLFNTVDISCFKPDLHNTLHWFPEININDLLTLKVNIEQVFIKIKDEQIYNFLLVCFASIIKKCSYADDVSPKPYVSSRINKEPLPVKKAFNKTIENYLKLVEEYVNKKAENCIILADDAREIHASKYDGKVDLAITSPPYINAFDYVRSLRLENAWLGFYGDTNIIDIKKKQVGTEYIPSKIYSQKIKKTGIKKLDSITDSISEKDKKRGYVVWKFFDDMGKNFSEVYRLLKEKGHYIVVIGNSKIRGIDVPTHELFIEIAEKKGFKVENIFSYVIRNRYIRIPRSGQGGYIDKDWVIDFKKTNGKNN